MVTYKKLPPILSYWFGIFGANILRKVPLFFLFKFDM